MTQSHLARLIAPRSWMIARKEYKWTARPRAGPHGINECVTINILLRELLGDVKTQKEIRMILNSGNLKIDGIPRRDYKFPVGIMDSVEVGKGGEIYRVLVNKAGRFYLLPIQKNEGSLKLLKIKNKRVTKGGRMQLTFHDGRTVLAEKFEGNVGDSVLFDLGKKSIVELLRIEKGALIFLTSGKHVGRVCRVKNIIKTQDLQKAKVVFEENGEDVTTLMDYAFVVGGDKTAIKLESEHSRQREDGEQKEAKKEARKEDIEEEKEREKPGEKKEKYDKKEDKKEGKNKEEKEEKKEIYKEGKK